MDFSTEPGSERGGMQPQTESLGRQRKGFFRSLFDLSFTSFVTARVVKFIYVISLIFVVLYVLSTVGYLSFIAYAFIAAIAESEALGMVGGVILFLLLLPILLLVAITYVRVLLEIVIVLFRISSNTAELVRQGRAAPVMPSAKPSFEKVVPDTDWPTEG